MARPVLGINNCWAVKRWPEPEVCLSLIRNRLQLDRLQLSADTLIPGEDGPDEAAAFQAAAGGNSLLITSFFTGGEAYNRNMLLHPDPARRRRAFTYYQDLIEFGGRLGCRMVGGHLGAFSARDYADPGRRRHLEEALLENLADLSSQAARTGCVKTLLWEPMPVPREIPHTVAETRRLLEAANRRASLPVRACLDLGHCCSRDVTDPRERDPLYWLESLDDLVAMVHLQQTDGLGDHHWPFNETSNAGGIIDEARARAIADWAASAGGDELELVLEIIPPAETPDDEVLTDLAASVRWWREILSA